MMTGRMQTERMTCEEVVSMGRYPYTGKMGILMEKDWQVVHDSLKLVQGLDLAERDLRQSVTARDRESFLQEPSARSRRLLYWMSQPHSWISVINWSCFISLKTWYVKRRWQFLCPFMSWIWPRRYQTM